MRDLRPEVLKAVRKSILQTVLVLALFLDFFLLYTKVVGNSLEALLRYIGTEFDWRAICQDASPSEWGQFCKRFVSKESRVLPSFSDYVFVGNFNCADLYTGPVFRVII